MMSMVTLERNLCCVDFLLIVHWSTQNGKHYAHSYTV